MSSKKMFKTNPPKTKTHKKNLKILLTINPTTKTKTPKIKLKALKTFYIR